MVFCCRSTVTATVWPHFAPLPPSAAGHAATAASAAAPAVVEGGCAAARSGAAQGKLSSGLDFASTRAIFERSTPAAPASQGVGRRSLPSRPFGQQDRKEHARQELREAMAIESEEQLTQAVRAGVAAGLDAQELREARGTLARLKLRDPARQALMRAIERGTEKALEDAVALGQRAGLPDEQLQEARQLLACLKTDILRRSLTEAVASGVERDLREALERADRLGTLEDSDAVSSARRALRKLVLLRSLQEALRCQSSDPVQLHRALREARSFGEFTEAELRSYSEAEFRQSIRIAQRLSVEEWQSQIEGGCLLGLPEPEIERRRSFITTWRDAIGCRDILALQAVLAEGRRLLVPNGYLAAAQKVLSEEGCRRIQEAAATASGLAGPADEGQVLCAICLEGGTLVSMPCCGREDTSNVLHSACALHLSRCPFCRAAAWK